MPRSVSYVPFGYEPPKEEEKGTILMFGEFDPPDEDELLELIRWADKHSFKGFVFYPQHEQTLRRMGLSCEQPYHSRLKELQRFVEEQPSRGLKIQVDAWEGKRKKYTPLETSLDFFDGKKYEAPFFVCMSGEYANRFASYPSFQEWIRKVRLLVDSRDPFVPHPQLERYSSRWGLLGQE